ncbi:hypothetical protein FRX31_004291 [Thalictrum thalictroides]|uniref:Uncharacterized protein n=1 Tax=Thalictrum thalictroides TaxID=46969 RepID=A0A7J6XBB3_THATH|nr:hypothetical protein FRX31_004291 [Thalictrum thalictroides]
MKLEVNHHDIVVDGPIYTEYKSMECTGSSYVQHRAAAIFLKLCTFLLNTLLEVGHHPRQPFP